MGSSHIEVPTGLAKQVNALGRSILGQRGDSNRLHFNEAFEQRAFGLRRLRTTISA